jgi:tetratricopeptide (TPR) repeat protein
MSVSPRPATLVDVSSDSYSSDSSDDSFDNSRKVIDQGEAWRRIEAMEYEGGRNSRVNTNNRGGKTTAKFVAAAAGSSRPAAKSKSAARISQMAQLNPEDYSDTSSEEEDSLSSSSDDAENSTNPQKKRVQKQKQKQKVVDPYNKNDVDNITDVFEDSAHPIQSKTENYDSKLYADRKSRLRRQSNAARQRMGVPSKKSMSATLHEINDEDEDGNVNVNGAKEVDSGSSDSDSDYGKETEDDPTLEIDENIKFDTDYFNVKEQRWQSPSDYDHETDDNRDRDRDIDRGISEGKGSDDDIININNDIDSPALLQKWRRNGLNITGVTIEVLYIIQTLAKSKRKNMTTREVVDEIIKPMTQLQKCSLVDLLTNKSKDVNATDSNSNTSTSVVSLPGRFKRCSPGSNNQKSLIGRSNMFITHAWDYDFDELIIVLENYEKDTRKENHTVTTLTQSVIGGGTKYYYWFDIFSINQWKPLCSIKRTPPPFWFYKILPEFIKSIGIYTVILLPWNKPLVLQRTWCLAEITACSLSGLSANFRFHPKRHNLFLELIGDKYDRSYHILDNYLITTENSYCKSLPCRDAILDAFDAIVALKRNDIDPPTTANVIVKRHILKWLDLEAIIINQQIEKDLFVTATIEYQKQFNNLNIRMRESFICHAFGCAELADTSADVNRTQVKLLECMQHVARLYVQTDNLLKAEEKYKDTLTLAYKTLGQRHSFTLTIMGNLAVVQKKLKKFDDSEKMFRLALQRKELINGLNHPSTVATMLNLSLFLKEKGEMIAARQQLQIVLSIQNDMYGENDNSTLKTRELIAQIYIELKMYDSSINILKEVLASKVVTYGKLHHETINVLETMGEVYIHEKKWIEAKSIYTKAMYAREVQAGKNDPLTLNCYNCMGKICEKLEEWEQSSLMYRNLLGGTIECMGGHHFGAYRTRDKILHLKLKVNPKVSKENITIEGRELYENAKKHLSVRDIVTCQIAHNLGEHLHKNCKNNFKEAAKYYRKSYHNRKVNLGEDSSYTLMSMHGLAYCIAQQKLFKEAYELFQELLIRFDKHPDYGPDHNSTVETLISFIEICSVSGDYTKSEECMRRLLQTYQKTLGFSHPKTMDCIKDLNNHSFNLNNSQFSRR